MKDLIQSGDIYELTAEAIPHIAWIADAQGCIVYFNQRGVDYTGRPREEALGWNWPRFIHAEDASQAREAWARAVETGTVFEMEYRLRRADGDYRWHAAYGSPVRTPEGRTLHWLGTLQDIEESKRLQSDYKSLLAREQSARSAVQEVGRELASTRERMCDAFIDLDLQWNCKFINERAARVLGRPPKNIIGRHFWSEFPDYTDTGFHRECLKAFAEQTLVCLEEHRRSCDRWFDYSIYPSPEGVSVYFHDVTAHKTSAQTLQESQAWLQLAIEASNTGLWDWDIPTNTVYYSPEWKRQLGYADSEIQNTFAEWESRVHPDDLESALKKIAAFLANPTPVFELKTRLRHKDGSYRWIFSQGGLVLDEHGTPSRMRGSHIDLTELKRAESELQAVNRALKTLTECNHALLRAQNEAELLQQVCQIVVEVGGYQMAWVGFAESDEGQSIRPAALHGFNNGYLETLHLSWGDNERGRVPAGTALRTGRPCLVKSIATDPAFLPFREEALKRGYASCIALPLVDETKPFGILAIYAGNSDAFDKEEVNLLTELANELMIGINALRARIESESVEQALQQSEASLANAQTLANMGSWELDLATRRGVWSAEMYRLFSRDPLLGAPPFEEFIAMIHPLDRKPFVLQMERDQSKRTPSEIEFRTLDSDGQVHWFVGRSTPQFSASGKLKGLVGTTQDITERKRGEQALRESEQKFRAITENSFDVILIHASDGSTLYSSPSISHVLGYSPLECDLPALEEKIHPDNVESVRAQREAIQAQPNHVATLNFRIRHRDNSWLHVEGVIQNMLNETSIGGFLTVLRDITDRQQAEMDLRLSQEQMRALAARIQNLRENEAMRIARELHDQLGRCLTTLKMDAVWMERHAQATASEAVTTAIREKAHLMGEAIDETVGVIRDICTQLRPSILDDLGLAAAVEWETKHFQRRTGIECEATVTSDELGATREVCTAFFRIFQEILTNITRHAQATRVWVNLVKEGEILVLGVEDNGIGISRERSSQRRTLGLLGMRERAAIFGGDVEISGSPGQGTNVIVRIPANQQPDENSSH